MKRLFKHTFFLSVLTVLLISCTALGQSTLTGSLPDGATYLIEVPAQWNGTLLLYSHGYVPPGAANPAQDVGDPGTRLFLLENGFALAGSSYPSTGWAVHEALFDQMGVLDLFDSSIGHPQRTIAWGHSMGGGITAGLIQRFPNRFDAALPMCGVLSGGVGIWNEALDTVFAFKTLLGFGTGLQVVHITDPLTNLTIGEQLLATAQSTPQGRARIALSAALSDFPGWFDPALPEPAATDFDAQEVNQFLWFANVDFPFLLAFRTELEFRAGGNPSFNIGVNYRKQLARSVDREEVEALYAAAGLSLDADLDTLNNAARITADPGATDYLVQNIIYNGVIHVPVLAMHTSGDGLVVPQNESAYQLVVDQANDDDFLRQTYVHRAGHCTFTPAETVTALGVLLNRLDTGRWSGLSPEDLNGIAAQLGPLNTAPPS